MHHVVVVVRRKISKISEMRLETGSLEPNFDRGVNRTRRGTSRVHRRHNSERSRKNIHRQERL